MNDPILITGGGTRLGLALANHYLSQSQSVAITYRTVRPEVELLAERGVQTIYADFSSDEGIYAAARELRESLPVLRAIIHNASAWLSDGDYSDQLKILALMMRIHVGAPMIISDALIPSLKASVSPSIVHISDHVANRGSDQHMAYAASKNALLTLTKSQAKKFAPHIRVNALCPALLQFRDGDDPEYQARARAKCPLDLVPGFDVAISAICYLQENKYTTGVTLPLEGGRSLTMS